MNERKANSMLHEQMAQDNRVPSSLQNRAANNSGYNGG